MLEPTILSIKLSEDELKVTLSLIVSLSQKMVFSAREGQWDDVIVLESERSPQLERLSAALTVADQYPLMSGLLRQMITSMIESDKEVATLAAVQKEQIAQGAIELGSSRKAVNAYLDNI